uniref:Uncharacterized protein n=1 Tax=Cynoglossus semilaevis TaxID=244447 RepID=A0A3P8V933_CYNSE
MIYTFSSDVRDLSFLFFASQESATKRRCVKGSQKNSAPESSSADCGDSQTGGSRSKGSCIICECHRSPGRTRCSESPDLEGLEGKENKLQTRLEWDDCSRNCTGGKQDCGSLDIKDTSATIFPDDDSNQILPIEQFFGNLDVVPDLSQESSDQKANRRRQFYAGADSDEDEGHFSCASQEDTRGV